MHFDLTTPKGLKITPSDGGKREREKEDKNAEQKADIPFNFWIVHLGDRFHKCRHTSI